MTDEPGRLEREWVDWKLAGDVQQLISERVTGRDYAAVHGLATLCVCIISTIAATSAPDVQKLAMISDVTRFLADLFNQGWDLREQKDREQPN